MFVRKPKNINGEWVVIVSQTASPLSPVIEKVTANTYVEAFRNYKQIMKELGKSF